MKQSLVHMKGTKEGFIIKLDEHGAFSDLLMELEQLAKSYTTDRRIYVQLHLGYRYCTNEQIQKLTRATESTDKIIVSKVSSDVVTVEERNRHIERHKNELYVGMVRSGQVLRVPGDIVIIGNVNQNGRVEAGGNIYVLGRLKGIAHAGVDGNRKAVVAASFFEATHIMIADVIQTMSNETAALQKNNELLCAHISQQGDIEYRPVHEIRNMPSFFMTAKGGS
ncbi:septum site-determining protein MinC [Lysinibacillus sp. BF-4]|uniref:septum site-determining protein MinC n=1 Tax=Lysinibacillus sp. BF-4 TaxID=1473546 RepID=UPI0005007824|nr:septum site-determining protein MinC [Lysinibacillus sp. BF-4]KFL44099.1 septum site-determining protein MinC [Lysinibacillus sp. BF-4]